MARTGIPAIMEAAGLSGSDGKRPAGMTLVPWREGLAVLWDVTVRDTLADTTYLEMTSSTAGAAAEEAVLQEIKCAALCTAY